MFFLSLTFFFFNGGFFIFKGVFLDEPRPDRGRGLRTSPPPLAPQILPLQISTTTPPGLYSHRYPASSLRKSKTTKSLSPLDSHRYPAGPYSSTDIFDLVALPCRRLHRTLLGIRVALSTSAHVQTREYTNTPPWFSCPLRQCLFFWARNHPKAKTCGPNPPVRLRTTGGGRPPRIPSRRSRKARIDPMGRRKRSRSKI